MSNRKECLHCGNIFEKPKNRSVSSWSNARFCSHDCYSKNNIGTVGRRYSKPEKKRSDKKCPFCGKRFYGERIYCSIGCSIAMRGKRKKVIVSDCVVCGHKVVKNSKNKGKKTCSRECAIILLSKVNIGRKKPEGFGKRVSDSLVGKRLSAEHRKALSISHLKIDSTYKAIKALRQNITYKEWRDSVFKRDNFKCTWCGAGGNIQADHIVLFSEMIKSFEITLGRHATFSELIENKQLWDIANGRTLCILCHKKRHTK